MEETQSERLQRKIREQPFMPIGKLKNHTVKITANKLG